MTRPGPLLLCIVIACGAGGCGEDFDPYNRLTSMRVLAIRSEPPLPGPGETATLSALIYAPSDDPAVELEWSWCPMTGPADQGHPCLVTDADRTELMQAGLVLPSFDLGRERTATLTHSIDPVILGQLCAGALGLPQLPNCEGGFPVQVKLVVRSATKVETAVRELRLRFDPATEPNANPSIEGLLAKLQGQEGQEEFQPISAPVTMTLPRDKETVVRALVSESASEEYSGLDNDRRPARVHELLALTWFIESGDTDSEHTSYVFGEVALADALENKWTPAKTEDYAAATSRIIVVIRDSRGGVSWTEGTVMLGEQP